SWVLSVWAWLPILERSVWFTSRSPVVAACRSGARTGVVLVELHGRRATLPASAVLVPCCRVSGGGWVRMGSMSGTFTTRVLTVSTGSEERVVDLTGDCEAFLRDAAAGRDGLLNVFVPHATAGIAVIETGAGSDDDLLAALHTLLPADDRWQ